MKSLIKAAVRWSLARRTATPCALFAHKPPSNAARGHLTAAFALVVIGSQTVVPAKSTMELGGYEMTAEAAPFSIHIFDKLIPIPAEPQLEVNLSYSRAKFSSGSGRALSSLLWPGDGIGYGLPEFLKNPDAIYPIKADAAHPSGPKDADGKSAPGTVMKSHADEKSIEANAALVKPALPGLPAPGIPQVPAGLVAVEGWSSQAKTVVNGDKVTATAYSTAGTISLLAGLVKLSGLRVDSEASSDAVKGTAKSTVAWKSITVAGQTFAVTQDGVGMVKFPKMPDKLVKRLGEWGLVITPPKVEQSIDGATGKVRGAGLTVSLDTRVLRDKLKLSWLLDPLAKLLGENNQLTPWLDFAPKMVFIFGSATVEATATPAYVAPAVPPVAGGGSTGGSSSGGIVDGGVTPETPPIENVASGGLPLFPAVPWWLIGVALALAAAASWGLRRYVAVLFGGVSCDLGLTNGIPNLRNLKGQ